MRYSIYKGKTSTIIKMKAKRIFRIIVLIIVCISLQLSSCSKSEYLDRVPPTQLVSDYIFDTPARILGMVNGVYAAMKVNNYYGGRFLMYTDVRGEEFINTTTNSFTGFDAWAHTYNSGSADIINLWSAAYTAINRANILIDGLSIAENAAVVGDELAAAYTAEAKFLRAYAYFSMITVFARPYTEGNGASPGLPLRLQAELSMDNNNLARSTVAQVYTQILQDLDDAEENLPMQYTGTTAALLNTTRAHKNTAIALKTRVYLNQGNWTQVIAEASKIVPQPSAPFSATTGVQHALQSDIVATLMNNFTTSESIFSMPFTELDMLSGQSSLGYIYNGNAEYYMNPAAILNESQWGADDARHGFLRAHATNGRFYLAKFGLNAPFLIYIPMIRYAEVLLNYAEAAAETGNLELATNLLQAVHSRSDADYAFPAASLASSEALVATILIERRIELLGEGFRSNDITRRLLTFPAKPGPTPAQAVAPSASNYIWPISNNELVNNDLID